METIPDYGMQSAQEKKPLVDNKSLHLTARRPFGTFS